MIRVGARVFPRCSVISQAIAFNLFLAFFPTLLLAVAFASSWIGSKTALLDTIRNFTEFLPPGSQAVVGDFLQRRGPDLWKFAVLGWAGTLLGGSQVMKLLMDGIHLIYGDEERIGFLHRQLRGLLLLLITIAPMLAAGILGVFGRPLRKWFTLRLGATVPIHGLWLIFFPAAAMVLAMLATLLWWLVNVVFGIYVRRVPYSVVYGGLAAVIGLLIWMQISAVIVFLGAAWNAEQAVGRTK